MGIETIAMVGLSAFSGLQGMKAAKSQAKAIAAEGAIQAENKAKETMQKAGAVRASFLNSGFDLFGTPESSIGEIYGSGQSDINRIISNANSRSKGIMSSAKSEAIGSIGKSLMGASFSSGFGISDAGNINLPNNNVYIPSVGMGREISGMPWLAG